jgi:PAS domain S-box-containing protein
VTFRRVSLPDTGLALTVVFDEAVAAGDDGRLRQRAQMLDSILEHIPLAVYFKDRDGRHVAVSDYLTRMNPNRKIINPEGKVHHTTDDIMGKTDFDLYPSELAEQTVADEQEVVENGEPVINKTEYTYTPDQELMRLSTSKAPWYGPNGEILGVVGITANITDEKRYEDTVDYQQTVIGMMQAVLDEPIAGSIEEVRRIVDELSADAATVSELSATVEEIEDHVAVVETLLREGQQEFGTELVDIEQIARQS